MNNFSVRFFWQMIVILFFILIWNSKVVAQFTESFTNAFDPGAYFDGTAILGSGSWDYVQIKGEISANSYNATGGAARLNKLIATGSYLITPAINSVGNVSFYYRELNSGGGTFKVQKSINGGVFINIGTQSFSGTSYALYSVLVNDPSNNIRIKIISINNPGFLIVDEVTLTSITSDPTIITDVNNLSNFTYVVGSGPSASQSYNLSGNNLTGAPGNIIVTAPADYEVSLNNSTFSASLNVPYTGSTLSSTPIYIRLITGLPVNSYNSEIITNAGGGAITVDVSCNGDVTDVSSICINEGFLNGTIAPSNWTFTNIGGTYTTTNNYGAASPSLKFDATTDRVETNTVASATELSFWIKGQSATGSYLLVEGFNGSSWTQVDDILLTSVTTGTTKTYNSGTIPALISGFTKFRFTYTKSTGNLSFDDVVVSCGSVVSKPEFNFTENINICIIPNPNNGNFELNFSGIEQSNANIRILNILGQIVYEKETEIIKHYKLPLQLNLETGLYFFNLSVNGLVITKKLQID